MLEAKVHCNNQRRDTERKEKNLSSRLEHFPRIASSSVLECEDAMNACKQWGAILKIRLKLTITHAVSSGDLAVRCYYHEGRLPICRLTFCVI